MNGRVPAAPARGGSAPFPPAPEFSPLSTCSFSFFPPSLHPLFLLPTLSCPPALLSLLAAPAWDVVNVVT